MRSPIDNIPTEIIQAIIDEVPASSPDLLSLRTVDRLLHRMATPNAFRRIRVGNNLTEVKGLKSIQESRDISKLVEQLIFDDRNDHEFNVGPHRNDYDYNDLEYRRLQGCLESAIPDLDQFSQLNTLSIEFWPTWKAQSSMTVQEHCSQFSARQLKLLDALYSTKPPPSLTSLSITNLCLLYRRPDNFRRHPSLGVASSLTDLKINLLSDDEHAKVSGKDDRPIVYGPRDYLPPSWAPLQSFTLRSPRGLFHTHDICPHGLFYPRLTSLSLQNISLGRPSSAGSMISFITLHKATLQTLEIISCPIIISGDMLCFWSDIWNRFATELTALLTITVAPPQGPTMLDLGYTTFVKDKEFETYLVSPIRVNSDRLALKRFEEVVEVRRRGI